MFGRRAVLLAVSLIAGWLTAAALMAAEPAASGLPSDFYWTSSPPLLTAREQDGWPWHAIKDPSVVSHEGEQHLFATVRGSNRSHAILYTHFKDWDNAEQAPRRILPLHAGYFCAPQVFFFEPQKKWYFICQASQESWGQPAYRAAYSTTDDITVPESWSPLQPLFEPESAETKIGLDFWVICDDTRAHLFSTTNNGEMWRRETALKDFPTGWSAPTLALKDDIFEASHTYKLKGRDEYLTIIEAQFGHGWRYYKAYTADRLDGEWKPLAATKDHAFASMRNVTQPDGHWTDNISHGELLRDSADQTLTIDAEHFPAMVYQGVLEKDQKGKKYGEIPWRLGLLYPAWGKGGTAEPEARR
ncbi:MAG: non-reducing end alpha-L-arabinofuranosidase family hydrolase [Planctomycetaceae bacterium]